MIILSTSFCQVLGLLISITIAYVGITDTLPLQEQEVLVPTSTPLVYHVGTLALVGYSQDFEADALWRE